MKDLHFTQEQVTKILSEVACQKEGFNKVLQLSLEALMRAERELHNFTKKDVSNGYRWRKAIGIQRQLRLQVPRTRYHHFYPVLLAVLKDQEEEMREVAFKLYGNGLTTQQVGEIFESIYGKHYSTSQISRLFDYAREEVKLYLTRPLESYYPIIYIDATYISTRRGENVSKEAYFTILGVKADRTREVLSIVNFPVESATAWGEVFENLKARGVERVDLVVSDALAGIEEAVAKNYSQVSHQFCVFHLKKNVLKYIKPKDKKEIVKQLSEVFLIDNSSDSIEKGWQRWLSFIDRNKNKYPVLERMRGERYRYYFTYLKYDYRIRSMIYTTNWIERLNRDYKRTLRMRGALPNSEAVILLMGYVAMNHKAYERKVPKLDHERSFQWEE
jgi:transposase-like protein